MTTFVQSEMASVIFDGNKIETKRCMSEPRSQTVVCEQKTLASPEEVRMFLLSQPASKVPLHKRLSMDLLKSTKATQKRHKKSKLSYKRTKSTHKRTKTTKSSHKNKQ